MDFQEVVRKRRMVREYDVERAVPQEVIDRILQNALRSPSAGFSQGFGFLVLDTQEDIARFRTAATPEEGPDSFMPVGAVSIGYSDEPPRDFSKRRKPMTELIHRSRWSS